MWNSNLLEDDPLNMTESAAEEAFSRIYQKKVSDLEDLERQESAKKARDLMVSKGVSVEKADDALIEVYSEIDIKSFNDEEKALYFWKGKLMRL